MGSATSLPGNISEDLLRDYIQLTYLSRTDILNLIKTIVELRPEVKCIDPDYRYPMDFILRVFPQLKYNPFQDRILKVFSSLNDEHLSFEDMLDLCSVMSENCPDTVKARWAFNVFDFNGDCSIDEEDIKMAIDRLTEINGSSRKIDDANKNHIAKVLLKEIDIQKTGSINLLEFQHAISKMPDFANTFTFRM
ncbi:hypothetical protein FQA39_LY06824 [Lamprigera yunnana]|nr:hypothetical protein FQA39_LY06824 [Lamprigera yunnana]